MTHLLVHIVKEINILDPVFLHNMSPFERYMAVLKKYIRNRSRPEGCIAKGYGTEEVIEFCVDFIDELSPIGVPMSRYNGRLEGKGTLGKKSNMHIPESEIRKANFTVLQNSSLVAPYMDEHINIVRYENIGKSEAWITRHTTRNVVIYDENFMIFLKSITIAHNPWQFQIFIMDLKAWVLGPKLSDVLLNSS